MIAAILSGAATLLLVGRPPGAALRRLDVERRRDDNRVAPRPRWMLPLVWIGGFLGVWVALGARGAGWLVIVTIVAGTVAHLVRGWRRRRAAVRRARETAQAARLLAGLLGSGQLPVAALAEAAVESPALRGAAMAARLGADVPLALRSAASRPGQEGLATVAAAWQVSTRSGAPIADVLAGVAEALRAEERLQSTIDAELAAARSSGRIMAGLPLGAAGLGLLVGVDSLGFLLGGGWGQVALGLGVALTAVGVVWIDRLALPRRPA